MGVQLYCDVDENGKIIESLVGERVVPMKQYQYFFFIKDKNATTLMKMLPDYRVINGSLIYVK